MDDIKKEFSVGGMMPVVGLSDKDTYTNPEIYKDDQTEILKKGKVNRMSTAKELLEFFYNEKDSNSNNIPDDIEPVVKRLEAKGYGVKYASPGHMNTNFKNDKNDDGIVNGKFTSTAKIVFDKDYKFSTTPEGWEWKILPSNNAKALYVKPLSYNGKDDKSEAYLKWQSSYIDNLKTWAGSIPKMGENKD